MNAAPEKLDINYMRIETLIVLIAGILAIYSPSSLYFSRLYVVGIILLANVGKRIELRKSFTVINYTTIALVPFLELALGSYCAECARGVGVALEDIPQALLMGIYFWGSLLALFGLCAMRLSIPQLPKSEKKTEEVLPDYYKDEED